MKHNKMVNGLVGDVIAPVQLQQIQGKSGPMNVAKTKIGFVEVRNNQQYRSAFIMEAWGQTAQALAAIPVGYTIMASGEFRTEKFKGQDGRDQFVTKFVVSRFGNCGPSEYPQQGAQPNQAAHYGQPPAQGYGAAPGHHAPPPAQHYPPQGQMNARGAAPMGNPPPAAAPAPAPAQDQWTEDEIPF